MDFLKPRYELFAREYAISGDGAQAADAAGYSHRSAHNQAWRMLQRPEVQARIAELRAGAAERECEEVARLAAHRARLAEMQATAAETLLAKLDPVYHDFLEEGDRDGIFKVVSLQAQIAGFLRN